MKKNKLYLALLLTIFTQSCVSTTEEGVVGANRKQFVGMVSSEQVNSMALQSFLQMKQEASSKNALDTKTDSLRRIQSIANRLIPQTAIFRKDAPSWKWETHVVTSDELNAFCMPGGKIVFYSGIIEKLKMTDGEIAAVMGHEIAHALREHGRERVAREQLSQLGLGVLMATGKVSEGVAQGLGTGSNLFLTLPNSRGQESEADDIGLELMARSGYNPQEAVNLWIKMSQTGGQKPPQMLSTHPSDETRIERIQGLIPRLTPVYQQTKTTK